METFEVKASNLKKFSAFLYIQSTPNNVLRIEKCEEQEKGKKKTETENEDGDFTSQRTMK